MKKLPLLPLLFSLVILATAATTIAVRAGSATIPGYWIQERLGTPNGMFFFVDADHGWATSGDLIYRTTNGGATWDAQTFPQGGPGGNGPITSIYFLNSKFGWISGHKSCGNVAISASWSAWTTDGGATWSSHSRCFEYERYGPGGSPYFYDAAYGWWDDCRTTDGGATWQCGLWGENSPYSPVYVRFTSRTSGYAVSNGTLLKTTDGATSWTELYTFPSWLRQVCASPDAATMIALGDGGHILRSTDRGVSWSPVASGTTSNLSECSVPASGVAWAAGAGAVLRSTDAGLTWTRLNTGASNPIAEFSAPDATHAWIYADELRRTTDGGATWAPLLKEDDGPLRTISMASSTTGWAGGGMPAILGRSGQRWISRAAVDGAIDSDALGALTGWVLSASGLRRTTDGGLTWQTFAVPITDAAAVGFRASAAATIAEGWLMGRDKLYRSRDGGASWTLIRSCTAPCYQFAALSVPEGDAQAIWLVSERGAYNHQLTRLSPSGAVLSERTWSGLESGWRIDAVDSVRAWLLGSDGTSGDGYVSYISRTTDGGQSWSGVRHGIDYGEYFLDLDFLNSTEGWAVGDFGRIIHTTDGGDTWEELSYPNQLRLNAVDAQAPGQAWMAGAGGQILHYSSTLPPGCWATPTPLPPFTGSLPAAATLSRRVASCVDDTYVRVDTESQLYDREYVRMGAREGGAIPYVDGFLFRDMRVPQGARITSARLRLQPKLDQSGVPVVVSIAGELHGQSGDFTPSNWWAHLRPRTVARVPWTLNTTVTTLTESPDISAIVQEIVALPDWQPGNNLVVLIDAAEGGVEFVNWTAYDSNPAQAAELVLDYVAPEVTATPTATPTSTESPTPTETPRASVTPTATWTRSSRSTWLPLIVKGR